MSEKLPTPPELEPIVAELDKFSCQLQWICLNAIVAPTTEQLQAVQTFFPSENLLSVRRRLVEGTARGRNVVIEFPSYHAALACWRSGEYAQSAALRRPFSSADIIIIEGV